MRYLRRLTLSQARTLGVDAAFVLALTAVAVAGLGATYTEGEYWWIAVLGALLATLSTVVVAVVLRWPTVVAAPLTLAWYFLLGPVLCLRQQDALPGPSSSNPIPPTGSSWQVA